MRNVLKNWIEYRTIKRSGLFDPGYYLFRNPDVRDADPLSHFIRHGWREGRDPSQEFDIHYYLETNPDVKNTGTNPLVHYVRYGQQEGRARNPQEGNSKTPAGGNTDLSKTDGRPEISLVLDLLHPEPYIPFVSLEEPIDLLIPVYNGREILDVLLSGIVKNTSIPYRLLLADDKSSDPQMSGYLQEFKKAHPELEIMILEHKANLGFVKTINELAGLTRNHFVILNTDTEVPPHWLERLMHPILTNEQTASTTPFSNAGVICSFPNFLEDNPLFENLDIAMLDSYFQYVNVEKNDVEVPTGVGFCMGINKRVWDKIGRFDEAFGKGYGEENDWCTRAIKAGYQNRIVPNLFVYHRHGGSLPGQEKKELSEPNSALLRKRHPDYFARVADFIQRDPLKDLRTVLKIKILSHAGQPKLILEHALGGGANAYSSRLASKDNLSILITPDGEVARNYVVTFLGQRLEEACFPMENIRDTARLLTYFNVREILLNELIGYPTPKILDLTDVLIKLKEENPQVELSFLVHDFFSVCPIYTLLDYNIQYCGVPSDLRYCDKCLKLNPLMGLVIPFVQRDYPELRMSLWREKFGALLDCSSRIVCFSQNSKAILQRAYPELPEEKFQIRPHATDWVRPVMIRKTTEVLNIAVIGHLNVHKGIHVVYSLASYIDYYHLDAKIHIFGDILDPAESFDSLRPAVKHGAFKKPDLPRLMEENEIDLVLIPSLWPETFSYTTDEAMNMRLPIAVFNHGAPAERVQHYEKGIVLQRQEPAYVLKAIYETFNKKFAPVSPPKKEVVFVCVSNNDLAYRRGVLSFAYMTEHPILKYDNRETNVPIPVRYNEAIQTLLESGYEGWLFFVHNDFSLLEPVENLVDGLDPTHLYGPIGAVLENDEKKLVGEILQGHKGGLIHHGSRIDRPTLVDTVDCQCLLVHTDLLQTYHLRFDEHELLSFHQYVEEFCLQASENYGVQTYALPMQCKHASWGTLNRAFALAIDYINAKYPQRKWAGTCTHLW